LDIALLNIMPDAAVKATDRQFARLLSGRDKVDFRVFTLPEIARTPECSAYMADQFVSRESILAAPPEALIVTGTNVRDPRLETQPFWGPLRDMLDWARDTVASTLCSCLASHAVLQFRYGQRRRLRPAKTWGVYDHDVRLPGHPLAAGLPPVVPVPQSRYNEVTAAQFAAAGLDVIIADETAGVHLAADRDNGLVLMQGHPEYDDVSLLKEYKREVRLFGEGVRPEYPPVPDGMVDEAGLGLFAEHGDRVRRAVKAGHPIPDFPEAEAARHLHENWHPASARVFANWLDIVEGKRTGP